jgi:nucleoid-associated protein YgaU
MHWENHDQRRYPASKKRKSPSLPIPSRILVGALAIAAIALAFILRPPQDMLSPTVAAPEAKPTVVTAAIVPIPTTGQPGAGATVAAATPAVPAGAPSASGSRIHEVVQGDTLSIIARKYYGDASKFDKILAANRDILKDADSLQLGMKLKIPE